MGKQWKQWEALFWGAPKSLQMVAEAMKLKDLLLGKKLLTYLDSILKSRDITLLTKVHQSSGFSSSHVWMWELNYKESWVPKNWCFWTGALEKTPESPLDCKEIQPVHPKGNQSWIFIGRTDAEAEAPILWPPNAKSWLIGKDPDAEKDWRQEEKGMAEDEMIGWHHWLWTGVWASSGSWWWTGKPGVLQSMGLQSLTRLSDWTELNIPLYICMWKKKYYIVFSHSSVRGCPGCFHVLTIVNSAAGNTGVHVIFLNYGFLQIYAQEWDWWVIW